MRRYQQAFFVIVIIAAIIAAAVLIQGNGNPKPANEDLTDLIRVYSPQAGTKITSPLKVTGEARGRWYFEATFPVTVVNWDGLIIGDGYATARPDEGKDWMTTEFTPFEGTIEFEKPVIIEPGTYNERGAVIFQKSNPSDLPENDAAVEIPVLFDK